MTQNIDGLHQAAGSKVVYELHGSTHRNYCMKCGAACDTELVRKSSGVPRCEKCGGMIKPDVVLYEESLNEKVLDGAIRLDCGGRSSDCRRNVTCGLSGGRPSPVF